MSESLIAESNLKVGENRGKRRVWLEGSALQAAGFAPGSRFTATVSGRTLTLAVHAEGDRKVSGRARGEKTLPVVDLNSGYDALFAGYDRMIAKFHAGKIVITPTRTALQKAKRALVAASVGVFVGGGLLSQSAEAAGFPVVAAVEVNADFAEIHQANHKGIMSTCSIHDADLPRMAAQVGPVGLYHAGVPCFTAGSLVLTKKGHIPIEAVAVGDQVLTHKGRWRMVKAVGSKADAPVWRVRAQGTFELNTTADHPLFVRLCDWRSNGAMKMTRSYLQPEWMAASNLPVRIPCTTRKAGEKTAYSCVRLPDRIADNGLSEATLTLLGRYLADGHIVDRKKTGSGRPVRTEQGRVYISCNHNETIEVVDLVSCAGLTSTVSTGCTASKVIIHDQSFCRLARQFGRGADKKLVPGWVFQLPKAKAKAFFLGYMNGDGWYDKENNLWSCTTINKGIAMSVGLLGQRVFDTVASIRRWDGPATCVIQGRLCNQNPKWKVLVQAHNKSAFVEGSYGWGLVRKSYPTGTHARVFNLHVAGDNSYCVDNIVVHNCEPYSAIRRNDGTNTKVDKALPPEAHELGDMSYWNLRAIEIFNPHTVLMEEVPQYLDSASWYVTQHVLRRLGYTVDARVLNSADYGGVTARKRAVIVGTTFDSVVWPAPQLGSRVLRDLLLPADHPDCQWFTRTEPTKSWLFQHWAKQRDRGNGLVSAIVQYDDRTIGTIKKRYLAGQGDNQVVCHPGDRGKLAADAADPTVRYRWLTVTEIKRLMDLPDSYYLGDTKTTAGEILGQGVHVGTFTQVIRAITRQQIPIQQAA